MENIRNLLVLLLSWCLLPLAALAQLPADAPKTKGQLSALEHKANNGDTHAQYVLACSYMNGVQGVVSAKPSKGKSLLKKAADGGDADACRLMYKMNPLNNVTYQEKALDIYRRQATGEACYKIADIFSNDRKLCLRWLKTAMQKGYAKAEKDLRSMHQYDHTSASFEAWCADIEPFELATPKTVTTLAQPALAVNDEEDEADDIDTNIPLIKRKNKNTMALIIGNEKYSAPDVGNVPFAERDAAVFASYCQKTLGIPVAQIRSYSNLTAAQMRRQVQLLQEKVKAFNGDMNVIFYYSGHGVPNGEGNDTYLLPVDADGLDVEICYSLKRLYSELEQMNAKNVLVLTDACFSGKGRGMDFIGKERGERGIARMAKSPTPQGKMVVFSAAQGDETAWPYKKKSHGLFTYFLLKKLQESQGECTLGELNDYLKENVVRSSLLQNDKKQTPKAEPSAGLQGVWRDMKITGE